MAELAVIVPVYNVEKYIRKCILSIVNQTYSDIEIIIVNDGTQDRSIEKIRDIINLDKRIKLINKPNGGLMSAWLEGVKNTNCEYIGFVDSDDWIDKDFYDFLMRKVKNEDADIVVGNYLSEDGKKTFKLYRSKDRVYQGKDEIKKLVHDYFYGIVYEENKISYCRWDKVYRRELFINNLKFFDTRISLGEDVNTNIAILPDCNKVVVSSKSPYYHYRVNNTSIVNTFNPKQIDNIEKLQEALYVISNCKEVGQDDINFFCGNMIFEQIKKICSSDYRPNEKKKMYKKVMDYEASKKMLATYAEKRNSFIKIFVFLFLKKRFRICQLLHQVYNFL